MRAHEELASNPAFVAALDRGATVRELAALFGRSFQTIQAARKLLEQGDILPEDDDTEEVPAEEVVELRQDGDHLTVDARGQALVKSLDDLVTEAGIDLEQWSVDRHTVKTWTTAMKGPDKLPRIVRNWGVTAHLAPRLLHRVADQLPVVLKPVGRTVDEMAEEARTPRALFVSDTQIGFRRRRGDHRLVPLHDRRAMDLVLQLAARLQPEIIVWLGDLLDFAEMSTKYPTPIELQDTAQPSLAELRWWLATFRATCPRARMVWVEGNHDDRIRRALSHKMPAIAALHPVGDPQDEALAMRRLLHLDELGVEYVGPYPKSFWLWDLVEVPHGKVVKSKNGHTASALVTASHHSTVCGHVHRLEEAHRTIWGPHGPSIIYGASLGCLCRIAPGVVPGVKREQDWQQAWGVVTASEDRRHSWLETGLIHQGVTHFRGQLLSARDPTPTIAEDLGYPMALDWRQPGE